MQKATIFTIFFSILVVTLVAELLTNDHLRDGWTAVVPPGGGQETSSEAASEFESEAETVAQTPAESSTEPSSTSPFSGSFLSPTTSAPSPSTSPSEVSQFVAETSYRLEGVTSEQLKSFGFENMRLERVSAEGLLFQLIDVSDIVNLSKIRFNLADGSNVYGVLTEFMFGDAGKASSFYDVLKQKGSAFAPDIKLNETNTFGARSFYMNDSKRIGTAFLAVLSDNRVFTLSYPKASHEFFKKLIQLLAKKQ